MYVKASQCVFCYQASTHHTTPLFSALPQILHQIFYIVDLKYIAEVYCS